MTALATRRSYILIAVFMAGCGGSSDSLPPASISGGSDSGLSAETSEDASPPTTAPPARPGPTDPRHNGGGALVDRASAFNVTAYQPTTTPESASPEVVLVTTLGNVRLRLDRDKAPLTVENFLANYVEPGHYNGCMFHHVEKGFMVAAGNCKSDGSPLPIAGHIRSEADNGLKNVRGTIAMTRRPDHEDTATSGFYVNLADNACFDHVGPGRAEDFGYCVFGEVIEGLDILERISVAETRQTGEFPSAPATAVVIQETQVIR